MPIPIIPILAAVGAGTLGFFIGRETAPCPAGVTCFEDVDEDDREDEETPTVQHAPTNEGEEARREEEGADPTWMNMSRAEAFEVLDVAPDATPDAIREAHQRVIQQIHPDQGGSRYLAAAINRAKVVLLG